MEQRFTNGDIERLVHSPAEAVRLKAAGWRPVSDDDSSDDAVEPVVADEPLEPVVAEQSKGETPA